MQLRADIQIQSVLKAMRDVVLPALDPTHSLAQEQARLCMGLLDLLSRQLPLQFRFDVDELGRLAGLAEALVETVSAAAPGEGTVHGVQAEAQRARDVLRRAQADPAEVVDAVRALRAGTAALVQAVCSGPANATVDAVERLVFDAGREQLLRDRSWLRAQGWEPNPDAIPPIETLLAPVRQA